MRKEVILWAGAGQIGMAIARRRRSDDFQSVRTSYAAADGGRR